MFRFQLIWELRKMHKYYCEICNNLLFDKYSRYLDILCFYSFSSYICIKMKNYFSIHLPVTMVFSVSIVFIKIWDRNNELLLISLSLIYEWIPHRISFSSHRIRIGRWLRRVDKIIKRSLTEFYKLQKLMLIWNFEVSCDELEET